jgi:hypothetical protein
LNRLSSTIVERDANFGAFREPGPINFFFITGVISACARTVVSVTILYLLQSSISN